MQISIVVPVYNVEDYLEETITSVINQTHQEWELLLVEDGSKDRSAAICKDFEKRDERIRYIRKENGGQASARNVGIREAKYENICFLDSDDIYAPDRLSSQIELVKSQPADFYYGGGFKFKSGENYLEKNEAYEWIYGSFSGDEFFKILYHSCAVNINTVLIKKSFLLDIGLFDEDDDLRGTEDWDLWLRIALKSQSIIGDPQRKVYYRIHEKNITHQRARMLLGKLKIYRKHDQSSLVSKKMRLKEYRYVFRELMNALHHENRSKEIKPLFNELKKIDPWSFVTIHQRILIHLFPTKNFLWISNKIIYRIGYRIESLRYKFMKS